MSLVKVSLLSDLDALALYPFKRLLMQRKGNQNYQQATRDYLETLHHLQWLSADRKRLRSIRNKLTQESDTFRLDGNTQKTDSLNGITIAKTSFPNAQAEEPIVIVKPASDNKEPDEIIATGLIQAVSESDIKIKLLKPLDLVDETAQELDLSTASVKSSKSSEPEASVEPEALNRETKPFQVLKNPEEANGVEVKKAKKVIDFKIRYDASKLYAATDSIDEYGLLVMETLRRFEAMKCDPVLHRTLLGLYDERTDLLHDKTRVVSFDGLAKPKGQQRLAIEQALKRRASLIEGPAGSGKTLVAALIAANMSRLKCAKILVCSPIQENVDKLAGLIHKIDCVQVVKLPDGPVKLTLSEMLGHNKARKQSAMDSEDCTSHLDVTDDSSNCLLDKLVDDEIYLQVWARSKDSFRNNHDSLHSHAYRMVTGCSQHRRREIEAKILSRADVVCCTNKQAGSYLLSKFEFDMLILDDVQITSEIDCLVPLMVRGIKQVVLLSDSRKQIRLARTLRKSQSNGQLTSNHLDQSIKSTAETNANGSLPNRGSMKRRSARRSRAQINGRSQSDTARKSNNMLCLAASRVTMEPGGLFERFLTLGLPTVDLRVQFRLHETLSNFTNHHFYLGRLKDDPETNKSLQSEIENKFLMEDEKRFDWLPNRKYLTAMFDVKSGTELKSSSVPGSASISADQILFKKIIEKLEDLMDKLVFHENVQESRIGIIFNRWVDKEANWAKKITRNVKTGTIADFIGQERDFVILVALPQSDVADDEELSTTVQLSICSELNCDFKHNDSALNCALTRARLGMMLIASDITTDNTGVTEAGSLIDERSHDGSATTRGCIGWRDLIAYYKASGLLVD